MSRSTSGTPTMPMSRPSRMRRRGMANMTAAGCPWPVTSGSRGGVQRDRARTGRWSLRAVHEGQAPAVLKVNRNHPRSTRFTTIAHELGHLYLGHLGADAKPRIPNRRRVPERMQEIEAESVAYLVGHRNGVEPGSDAYLAEYIKAGEPIGRTLDVERVVRAAGAVERAMGLDGGRGRKAEREARE